MTERNNINSGEGWGELDALAAEYVLGTLDGVERAAVAARLSSDARLHDAVRAWEQRLSPLNDLVPPIVPPPDVWNGIESRLDRTAVTPPIPASASTAATGTTAATDSRAATGTVISLLERRLRHWRRVGITASALAAAFLIALGTREFTRTATPQSFVAVFQKDDAVPAFLLSIDLEARRLSIQAVAAETPPGKSYQLWIAPDASGRPRSVGVLEARGFTTQTVFQTYDPAIVQAATFGVSLEPAGGSPTGQPTGPVFHAKLIPTPR